MTRHKITTPFRKADSPRSENVDPADSYRPPTVPEQQRPYWRHFNRDELEAVLDVIDDPTAGLDAAIDATYILLERIIARLSGRRDAERSVGQADYSATDDLPQDGDNVDAFLKLVKAHNDTTGRIAVLARARQVVGNNSASSGSDPIATALAELAEVMQVNRE